MATAFVQGKASATFGGTSYTITLDAPVTPGNTLAVAVFWADGAVDLSTVTDAPNGNAYVIADNSTTNANQSGGSAYAKDIAAGTPTITITATGNISGWARVIVHEISGADTAAPLNAHAALDQDNPGTGTDAVTSGAAVTTVAGCYIFGASFCRGFEDTPATGTGFTTRISDGGFMMASEDLIQGAAGSIAATFTNANANSDEITFLMAFQPPSGAPAGGAGVAGSVGVYAPRGTTQPVARGWA